MGFDNVVISLIIAKKQACAGSKMGFENRVILLIMTEKKACAGSKQRLQKTGYPTAQPARALQCVAAFGQLSLTPAEEAL
jgi:hypothetical protein